jgi:hypothetical protein
MLPYQEGCKPATLESRTVQLYPTPVVTALYEDQRKCLQGGAQ